MEKPNIILMVMDSARHDHMPLYGYSKNITPNIDEFAKDAAVFENAFTTSNWTLPTHASIFTGLYPSQHNVNAMDSILGKDIPTIAGILQKEGYETISVIMNPWLGKGFGLDKGFSVVDDVAEKRNNFFVKVYYKLLKTFGFLGRAFLINYIAKKHVDDCLKKEKPFFLFLNYMDAHYKFEPPIPYRSKYLPKGISYGQIKKASVIEHEHNAGKKAISEQDLDNINLLLDSSIEYLDFEIGRLFNFLKERGIFDNTLIILTSDHGDLFCEHKNWLGHRHFLYEELIRIPLLIRYPKLFGASRTKGIVQITDIFPTILDAVGVKEESKALLGKSLIKRIKEKDFLKFAIAEQPVAVLDVYKNHHPDFDVTPINSKQRAIRTLKYEYILSSDGKDELYNIEEDPKETKNLVEQRKDIRDALKGLMDEWLDKLPKLDKAKSKEEASEEMKKRLEELGYF